MLAMLITTCFQRDTLCFPGAVRREFRSLQGSAGMLISAPPLVGSLTPYVQLVYRKNICLLIQVYLKSY